MRHLFKCSECGSYFEKTGTETICNFCAIDQDTRKPKKQVEVQEKKKTGKKK